MPEGPAGLAAVPMGGGGAWPGFEATRRSATQAPLVWRVPEGPEGLAAVPVGGGGAWPSFETTHRTSNPAPPVWRVPEGPAGLAAVLVGGGGARTKQKSHIISYGHFWRPPTNVAIPTTAIQILK